MSWFKTIVFESVTTEDNNELIAVHISDGIHYQDMFITPEFIEDSMINVWSFIRKNFEEAVSILEKEKQNEY